MVNIIATLGPATAEKDKIQQLQQAGADMFRLNFAHEKAETALPKMKAIHEIAEQTKKKMHILADVEGPGIRTGVLKTPISYVKGEKFKIFVDENLHEEKSLFCDYTSLCKDVKIGRILKIDSGLFKVKIIEKNPKYILVEALNDFQVGSRRHINLPGVHVDLPSFTDKDKQDVLTAIQGGCDYVALSFVRSADDMRSLRDFLDQHGAPHIKIVAKIENEEGIKNIDEIAKASDIVMVARGDLGTELSVENIPVYQLDIIKATKEHNKKVIVATEMLESMTHNPSPTRAEVNDVFYAVVEGADYVMLSGETAVGEYPVECVQMMEKVIHNAKKFIKDVLSE